MSDKDNADTASETKAEIPVKETGNESGTTEASGQQEQPQDGQRAEKPAEEEKIVLTQQEYDARAAAIRNMAERRAKRKAEEEFKAAQQQQPIQAQQPQNISAPQSPDDVWDDNLKMFIPKNMTVEQYSQLAGMVQTQQPAQQQTVQQAPVNPPQTETGLTENAELQLTTLASKVGESDIRLALSKAPISDTMVNAVAVDKYGIENLYNAIKDRPHEIYQICQLSPMEQQAKMWELNKECAKKRAPKVQTSATPQPAPLKEGGDLSKSYTDMSYEEIKAARSKDRLA
jgi:hypothetical protein